MKRRYLPAVAFPEYNNAYDRYLLQSQILSSGNNSNISVHTILWDKESLLSALIQRKGDQKGLFRKQGEVLTATIPYIKMQLALIDEEFNNYTKARLNQGYPKPEKMPNHMLSRKYVLEAHLDITLAEVQEIEKKLAEINTESQGEDDANVLAYGLKLAGHMHGTKHPYRNMWNVLADLDGQKIGRTSKGLLIIDDSRSPYDGLSVEAYRKLAAEWQANIRKADAEKLKIMQQEALSKGEPIPKFYSRGTRKVSKSSLPAFPSAEKNWKKNPVETSND